MRGFFAALRMTSFLGELGISIGSFLVKEAFGDAFVGVDAAVA
jgi:hypothetical protein